MGYLPRSACLGSLSLTKSSNSLVYGECLEIRDNHLCAIRINMRDSKWTRPAGFQFTRENLQSGVKEEDSITDVENTDHPQSKDQSLHVSRPSRLCAQAQSGNDMPFRKQAYMKSRTQRSNLALESFLAKSYLRAEWSVYTMLLFMM
nr:hypothetical protein [Tanacetum cinerariifolium]